MQRFLDLFISTIYFLITTNKMQRFLDLFIYTIYFLITTNKMERFLDLFIYTIYFLITTNKMQSFLDLFISTGALHVSGGSSAHHQEHKNCTYNFRYCQPILLLAAIVDEMELRSISSTVEASSSIG